ncbi:MAG: hypothetical protein IKO10_11115 [Lachnospiraceae bacterium]|nr:hypothetical protein [Lachnospiraceae bacterium]
MEHFRNLSIDNRYAYIYSPYGIGDLVIICGLKKSVEEKYNVNIRFIVKPAHIIVMKAYKEEEYLIHSFSDSELKRYGEDAAKPTPGKIFIAHPFYHGNGKVNNDFLNYCITFKQLFMIGLGISDKSKLELPAFSPSVSGDLLERTNIKDLERAVLILPEMKSASSYENMPVELFEDLIKTLKEKKYYPIVNISDDTYIDLKPYSVEMSLEEVAALACSCRYVISMRSGLCDLIFPCVKMLNIIYPNYSFWKLFNLEDSYGAVSNSNIKETVLSISKSLFNMGYRSCALYGYGNVGKRILYSLTTEGFPVEYIIDQNKNDILSPIDVYGSEDELPGVDVVLITLSCQINEIKKGLSRKIDGDVIDLHELWMKSGILKELGFYEDNSDC